MTDITGETNYENVLGTQLDSITTMTNDTRANENIMRYEEVIKFQATGINLLLGVVGLITLVVAIFGIAVPIYLKNRYNDIENKIEEKILGNMQSNINAAIDELYYGGNRFSKSIKKLKQYYEAIGFTEEQCNRLLGVAYTQNNTRILNRVLSYIDEYNSIEKFAIAKLHEIDSWETINIDLNNLIFFKLISHNRNKSIKVAMKNHILNLKDPLFLIRKYGSRIKKNLIDSSMSKRYSILYNDIEVAKKVYDSTEHKSKLLNYIITDSDQEYLIKEFKKTKLGELCYKLND